MWLPYLRGERVPYHDPSLRAGLYDLDICDTPEGLGRAAYEASGFVVRNFCERAGITPRRIVASGGGTRSEPWMAAVADASGLPIDCVAVPEGAARGAAYLARMAAGLEADLDGARRWAAVGRRVEPDPTLASGLRPALPALRRSRLRPLNPGSGHRFEGDFHRPALLLVGEHPQGVVPPVEREAVGEHGRRCPPARRAPGRGSGGWRAVGRRRSPRRRRRWIRRWTAP